MDLKPAFDREALGRDAAQTLSQYLQIDTTNPPGNELQAARWLAEQLRRRGVCADPELQEPAPGRGLLLARVPGMEDLRPLLLNHHMDVVAADPAAWTHHPFSGTIADGYIWGRGALDMKGMGVIFMLALEQILRAGIALRRPVLFLAVPDEETGGDQGMRWLVETSGLRLDPEWVWDEGGCGLRDLAGPGVLFGLAVAEKKGQQLKLRARGRPGHASMPHNDNAVVILTRALSRLAAHPRPLTVNPVVARSLSVLGRSQPFPASLVMRNLRRPWALAAARRRLESDGGVAAMLRDTLTPTMLEAGYKINVIPEEAEAQLDCRLLPDTDVDEFLAWVRTRLGDPRVTVEPGRGAAASGIAPMDGSFVEAVTAAVGRASPGAELFPMMLSGATDGRYWRARGYPAYGLSPVILQRSDLASIHGIDERISIDNLVLGVTIAMETILALCGPPDPGPSLCSSPLGV